MPAALARGWEEATIPWVENTVERLEVKGRSDSILWMSVFGVVVGCA